VREHVEARLTERFDSYNGAVGEVIGTGWRTQREQWQKEDGLIQSRLELLQREVTMLRERQEQEDALTRYEIGIARREYAVLQKEIGLERAVRALHDEVEAAKTEIPRLPEIEARVDAKQSKLAAEQKRLGEELAKQKDRIGKLRVDQSVTEYGLKEDLKELKRAQQPVVELKFESVDGQFTMRDMHPDAATAWRRFVAEMVASNDGTMFPNDPGNVISMPVPRRDGNAA
jgi:hypothetical protein